MHSSKKDPHQAIEALGSAPTSLDMIGNYTLDATEPGNFWHLKNGPAGARFAEAHEQTTGNRVLIGIVDEGVNYHHASLDHAYNTARDVDVRDPIAAMDAMPDWTAQRHGTRVAGLISGDTNDELGTAGAASDAAITATFLRYGEEFRFSELEDIVGQQKCVDVSNNSWGFTTAFADNFADAEYAPISAALLDVIAHGRGGLGTSMVFAAGNTKEAGDDTNFHSFTASRLTIAVGAHDEKGRIAAFSTPGATVMLTAPGVALTTTNVTANGEADSTVVSGTSFATPLVSSAVALMLEANPDLGYRDVQEILALSAASRVDGSAQSNGAGFFNGGGLMFSREGGFGKLDAQAAVALARNWTKESSAANEKTVSASFAHDLQPNGDFAAFTAEIRAPGASGFTVQHAELSVDLSDAGLKDLKISLISPDGTRTAITQSMAFVGSRAELRFDFGSVANWGENGLGTWRVEFDHVTPSTSFSVHDANLKLFGDFDTLDDTIYITASFAGLVRHDAGRATLKDIDGGVNTINFAAARIGAVVDLAKGAPSFHAGVALKLQGAFSNLIGSSDADVFRGTSGANLLVGEAGADILVGRGGKDTLRGGEGDDRLAGGAGNDIVDGGAGFDTAVFAGAWTDYSITRKGDKLFVRDKEVGSVDIVSNVESLVFGTGSMQSAIEVSKGARPTAKLSLSGNDRLVAGGGSDRLDGGRGADVMIGGAGGDRYVVDDRGDRVVEKTGQGVDTVESSVSFLLGKQSIEKLVLKGNGDIGGTGNDWANTIIGNAGDNKLGGMDGSDRLVAGGGGDRLDGGRGADVMIGGAGGDRYVVDNRGDRVVEKTGQGVDTVESSVSFLLGKQSIEKLVLKGNGDIGGTGNDWANTIIGNAGDNKLGGMGGNDRLLGGKGADDLWGGTGKDCFVFTALSDSTRSAAGRDTIFDFGAGDRIDLSTLDANTKVKGNQSFSFIHTEAFDGHAGELRFEKRESDIYVYADVNGDKKADFSIHIDDTVSLTRFDFLL